LVGHSIHPSNDGGPDLRADRCGASLPLRQFCDG
jgi:hypothetical protein